MTLQEIKQFIVKEKIEKQYNQSLNYYKINSISNSFSSSESISEFYKTQEEMNYNNYYNYLTKTKKIKFSDYLAKKAEGWIEKDHTLDKKKAIAYLLKIFVINPVDGKIKELSVKKKIIDKFYKLKIIEPTGEQDIQECWDLKIHNDNICFYLQVKPASFFYSLSNTSYHSLKKIENASNKYQLPIFLVREKNGFVDIYIRDINDIGKCKFLPLRNFAIDKLNQTQIKTLSAITFSNLMKENTKISKIKFKK